MKREIHRGLSVCIVLGSLVALAGCRAKVLDVVPVSGAVTYRGEPLEGAEITFLREGGPPARGTTDAQGRFRLRTYVSPSNDLVGAVPGEYTVRVVKLESLVLPGDISMDEVMRRSPSGPKQLVPKRYADVQTTDLRATVVKGEKNQFQFTLTD